MPSGPSRFRKTVLLILIIFLAVGVAGWVGLDVMKRAGGMRAASTPAAVAADSRVGTRLSIVVRLEASGEHDTYDAQLLDRVDDSTYRVTRTHIRVMLGRDTAVEMGGAGDIKPDAIVQASGIVDSTHALRANRIAILTGFIKLVA
jgi:hypothetical protein